MQLTSLLIGAPAIALALVGLNSGSAEAASIDRRLVGTLSCKTVKTGRLELVDTKTSKSLPATLDNNYRLSNALNGSSKPESVQGIGNPRLLSSYEGITTNGDVYNFQACTESERPGFEDYPAESKSGVYYGHLSPQDSPKHCLNKRNIYGDDEVLTSEPCYYSDDSGSPFSYFSYDPSKNGVIHFLQYTGKKGAEPRPADAGTVTFTPGDKANPAVYVHDGSADFSDYELRLV